MEKVMKIFNDLKRNEPNSTNIYLDYFDQYNLEVVEIKKSKKK